MWLLIINGFGICSMLNVFVCVLSRCLGPVDLDYPLWDVPYLKYKMYIKNKKVSVK